MGQTNSLANKYLIGDTIKYIDTNASLNINYNLYNIHRGVILESIDENCICIDEKGCFQEPRESTNIGKLDYTCEVDKKCPGSIDKHDTNDNPSGSYISTCPKAYHIDKTTNNPVLYYKVTAQNSTKIINHNQILYKVKMLDEKNYDEKKNLIIILLTLLSFVILLLLVISSISSKSMIGIIMKISHIPIFYNNFSNPLYWLRIICVAFLIYFVYIYRLRFELDYNNYTDHLGIMINNYLSFPNTNVKFTKMNINSLQNI